MRLSWMWRNSPPISGAEMSQVINELDSSGYYSILFPIESVSADYLPQAIRSIDVSQKIKYMIPVRPYLLSPQYLTMLSAGIEKIAPERTIFNFIYGHLSEEENLSGVIASSVDFSKQSNRRSHLKKFISTLKNIEMYDKPDFSECLISGGSQETLEIASQLGVNIATSYFNFLENYDLRYSKFNFNKIYAQVGVLPRKTDEEAEAVRSSMEPEIDPAGVLCGSYETIAMCFDRVEKLGVTDILLNPAFESDIVERQHIHEFAEYMANRSVRVNMSIQEG